MSLKTKFILAVTICHLVALAFSLYFLGSNRVIFFVSEILIIASVMVCWQFYKQLIQPLQLLVQQAASLRDGEFNVKLLLTGRYEMDELITVYNQMLDKLRAERVAQEQQQVFVKKLILTSPTGIVILDYDDHIHEVNPKALKLIDIPEKELVGKHVSGIAHPLVQMVGAMKSGESKTINFDGVNTYKLQKSHFIDRGFARHFVMIEELTTDIIAAERKAYGKVIRMMAHEVNNTIGPVNSILQTAFSSGRLAAAPGSQSLQNALQVAIERNQNLNTFMRNFTEVVRLPEPRKTTVDLHALVRSLGGFFEMMRGSKPIRFEYHLADTPFTIMADEPQMEQAIINIVKNAVEAIPENGAITFTTQPGHKLLSITDNGQGIDPQNLGELFSPFFSTKKEGQGIGLTLVKEILVSHGYSFRLHTTEKGETEFMFRFGE